MDRKRVIFFINDLTSGGAQNTLRRVLSDIKDSYNITIITFFALGPVGLDLKDKGFNIQVFDKWNFSDFFMTIRRLFLSIRNEKPDFIFTFLYFSDIVGGVFGKLAARKVKIIWNVRNDVLYGKDTGTITFLISRLNVLFSYIIPCKIIYCSKSSFLSHTKIGYNKKNGIICENNIDKGLYYYDENIRTKLRRQMDISDNAIVFCMGCRYDKIKNIPLFTSSIRSFETYGRSEAIFLMCGAGMTNDNIELRRELETKGILSKVILLGYIENMPAFLSAVDCIVVTSKSEGSPNIIYEAIASGASCITTKVIAGVSDNNVVIIEDSKPESFANEYDLFCCDFAKKHQTRISSSSGKTKSEQYRHNLAKEIDAIIMSNNE